MSVRLSRRGSVLPMLGVCLIALFAFVALAVDLGMLAVNRTQCQNAADAAVLVGCRNLDNKRPDDPGYDSNRSAAVAIATATATSSALMSGSIAPDQVARVRAGTFDYDPAARRFAVAYPSSLPAGRSWTAMEVVLTATQPTYFMRVWGVTGMPSGARAVAVHRPRDVAFVLDMTGSMAYASQFNSGNVVGTANDYQSMNPDPLVPAFGHYAAVPARLVAGSNFAIASGEAISRNNVTITTPAGPPIIRGFTFNPANAADPTLETELPADPALLRNAFHRWSPPESGGDSATYTAATYDFTGYDAFHRGTEANPRGPTPAPASFGTMTDSASPPIAYVGDRWRRADGSLNRTDATWDAASPGTRAAATAVELLGYRTAGPNVLTPGGAVVAAEEEFRDPVWEANGYDLDIVKYRADRGGGGPLDPAVYTATRVPAADRFQGFSMGPGYWGKTFYIWPPDPRAPVGHPGSANYQPGDWRRRYFLQADGARFDPQGDNNGAAVGTPGINAVLLNNEADTNGTGLTVARTAGFRVDYAAVLKWIKSGPPVLPPNLRAGRVLYYSSIPDDVDAATGTPQQRLDKVFWKRYIDYVLGVGYYATGYTNTNQAHLYGLGDNWSAAPRGLYQNSLAEWRGPDGFWPVARPYLRYADSPYRPRLHFWFGPLSLLDFLGVGGNALPGTCHEAQSWQLKAGMNSVLDDIRNNHPNDTVGLVLSAYDRTNPIYKDIRVAQGQDFVALKNALFYPRSLLPDIRAGDRTREIRPYDLAFAPVVGDEIPNAKGSTDPNTGLMLAFNLLSPSASLPASYGPVRGRRGAGKIVIFETDGVPNAYSNFTLNLSGYDTHYADLTNGAILGNGDATATGRALAVVRQMVKPIANSNGGGIDSGLSLANAPARVYPIGFGDLFDTALAPGATYRPAAHQFLADVGIAGKTLPAGATTLPASQVITGPYQNRIDTLKSCLERIFQGGVSVTLIE